MRISTIVPVFVDTNVLVYARDSTERAKQERAFLWVEHLWRTKRGRVSYQVLQEFYVTVTRKLVPGLPVDHARADVRDLLAWRPVGVDEATLDEAWSFQDRFGLSFWDALILASAKMAGCEDLLTEDLQDGQTFDGVRVIDPFANEP